MTTRALFKDDNFNNKTHCLRRQLPSAESKNNSVKFRVCPWQKLKSEYEEAESNRAGGEGDSSRAYGIPDGTGNYQLHGSRTVLNDKRVCQNRHILPNYITNRTAMISVIWFFFQYLGGEFVGCLNDGEQGTRADGMDIVLLHFLVVEGKLPGSHMPTNGEDFVICQL